MALSAGSSAKPEKDIHDLPTEVLAKIFDYLPSNTDHHNIAKASENWGTIIEDYLGIAVVVGTEIHGYFVQYPSVPLDRQIIMAAYTWACITPDPESKGSGYETKSKKAPPVLKKPYLMKKLVVMGNIDHSCLREVTTPLRNLTGLCLHITVFENGRVFSKDDKLDLPNLKYLVLDDTTCVLTTDDCNVNAVYESASSLLKLNSFRSLERLGIEFPLYEPREACLTEAIVDFVQKHTKTLKALTIHQKYEIDSTEDDFTSNNNADDSGKESDENENEKEHDVTIKMLSRSALKLKNVKLEEIYISLFDTQDSSPLWKNFLSHQTVLQRLFYINYEIPFPQSLIQKNISSLRVLVVNVKTCIDFNCFMDNQCRIRTLVLIGKNKTEPEIDIPDARNLDHLPNSVNTLKLCGVTAYSRDISVIALQKPNLKELILEEAGSKYQLGMTLETYGIMLGKKELHRFKIKNSFNIASFSDISNIPVNVEGLATVFLSSKQGLRVEGTLDKVLGRYIMNCHQQINTDLEGEGADVFNLLSGIMEAKNNFHYDNESSAGSESETSDRESDGSHSPEETETSDSDSSSGDEETGSGGDRGKSETESDLENLEEDQDPASSGDGFKEVRDSEEEN